MVGDEIYPLLIHDGIHDGIMPWMIATNRHPTIASIDALFQSALHVCKIHLAEGQFGSGAITSITRHLCVTCGLVAVWPCGHVTCGRVALCHVWRLLGNVGLVPCGALVARSKGSMLHTTPDASTRGTLRPELGQSREREASDFH